MKITVAVRNEQEREILHFSTTADEEDIIPIGANSPSPELVIEALADALGVAV